MNYVKSDYSVLLSDVSKTKQSILPEAIHSDNFDGPIDPIMRQLWQQELDTATTSQGWVDPITYSEICDRYCSRKIKIDLTICGDVEPHPGPRPKKGFNQHKKKDWKPKNAPAQDDLVNEIARLTAELDNKREKEEQRKAELRAIEKQQKEEKQAEDMAHLRARLETFSAHYDVIKNTWGHYVPFIPKEKIYAQNFRFISYVYRSEHSVDLRPVSHSQTSYKYEDPILARVEHVSRYFDSYGFLRSSKRMLIVSLEMLSQLTNPKVCIPGSPDQVVAERIAYTAQHMLAVNWDRYRFVETGVDVVDHTQRVAYAMYKQSQYELRYVPFPCQPAHIVNAASGSEGTGRLRLSSIRSLVRSLILYFVLVIFISWMTGTDISIGLWLPQVLVATLKDIASHTLTQTILSPCQLVLQNDSRIDPLDRKTISWAGSTLLSDSGLVQTWCHYAKIATGQ